jgi:hypothetical protein
MINGATQILAGVPGKHLDPLLLAQSQSADAVGFIMIAYQRQLVGDSQPAVRYYDLLFFQGSQIVECARLNQDLRFQLHRDGAIETFRKFGREETTRVFLFLAPDELLHRFRSTFYYEPCLKVQVKALSKKQIVTLLMSTGCQRGIIECNEFTQLAPSIELLEISSPDDIIQYHPKFKHGRILLYDIEKNKELVQERYAVLSQRLVQASPGSAKRDEGRYVLLPSIHIFDSSKARDTGQADPTRDEQEAEEFTEFIKKILNSPAPSVPEQHKEQGFIIDRKEKKTTPTDERQAVSRMKHKAPRVVTSPDHQGSGQSRLPVRQEDLRRREVHSEGNEPPSQPKVDQIEHKTDAQLTQAVKPGAAVAEVVNVAEHPDYVRLFERMFRSFRQQMFDCYGDRSEAVIAEAERKVRFLTPEFDLRFLNNETAILTLDLVETIVDDAPFFKRSRLRDAALTLVADLYNKHYELLENHRAIERVEQCYFRLKR